MITKDHLSYLPGNGFISLPSLSSSSPLSVDQVTFAKLFARRRNVTYKNIIIFHPSILLHSILSLGHCLPCDLVDVCAIPWPCCNAVRNYSTMHGSRRIITFPLVVDSDEQKYKILIRYFIIPSALLGLDSAP